MIFKLKDESLKLKDKTFLEQYLAGKAPLHANRLSLPSDEELDAAEAEFDAIVAARKKTTRHIPLRPWVVAAVAASILLLLVFNISKETIEEKPVVAEVIEPEAIEQSKPQPAPQPIVEEKEDGVLAEAKPIIPSVPRQKRAIPACVSNQTETTTAMPSSEAIREEPPVAQKAIALSEPEPQQPVIVIPADKQALADIFLAEEALQVAYERRAQQDAIRAYAASIMGEEAPKPIIAY